MDVTLTGIFKKQSIGRPPHPIIPNVMHFIGGSGNFILMLEGDKDIDTCAFDAFENKEATIKGRRLAGGFLKVYDLKDITLKP